MQDKFKSLKKLKERSSCLLKEQIGAIDRLLATHLKCSKILAEHDEGILRLKYEHLLMNYNFECLSDEQFNDGSDLECKIKTLEKVKKIEQDTVYTLQAIEHFFNHDCRNEILTKHSRQTWYEKHEILTRWAWITNHYRERVNGHSFNSIYLCEVGQKNKRRSLDIEFQTFLKFLPNYCKFIGKDYLFEEKKEPPAPDFLINDETGNRMFIEITEAFLNPNQPLEEKQREFLYDI